MNEDKEPTSAEIDARYKRVRCSVDGKEYICTPYSDYFNATGEDENGVIVGGVCEDHLFEQFNLERIDPVKPINQNQAIIGKIIIDSDSNPSVE